MGQRPGEFETLFWISSIVMRLLLDLSKSFRTDLVNSTSISFPRIFEKVKTLLESKTHDYERSMMDYGRVFQLVKSKLVRERGLIL